MKKFLLTQQLQSDFLDSLKNNEIKSWCSKYHQHLEHIYDILTPVKIQLQDKKKEAICQYLCSYFLDLLCCLENPDALELLKTDKFRKLREIFKNNAYKPIAQFEHEFVNCLKNEKQRNRFWKSYEKYFDDLILELATRKVLDIGIEGADQIIYRSFRDARNKEREIPCNGGSLKKQNNASDPLDNFNGTTVEFNRKPLSGSFNCGPNSVNMTQREEKPDETRFPNGIKTSSSNQPSYHKDVSEDVGEHEDHYKNGDETLSRQPSLSSEVSLEWSRQLNQINEQFQQKMNADNAKYAKEIREMLGNVDKLFLQHRIRQVATHLSYLLDKIGDHQIDKESFAILQCLEKKIDSMDIRTTKALQQICATASMEEYKSVGLPKKPASDRAIVSYYKKDSNYSKVCLNESTGYSHVELNTSQALQNELTANGVDCDDDSETDAKLKMEFEEKLRKQNIKNEKKLRRIRLNRQMLKEEIELRARGGFQTRTSLIQGILNEFSTVLFVGNPDDENNQHVIDVLTRENIEFEKIQVDQNASIRLALKEKTGCDSFPQLLIDGILVDVSRNNNFLDFLKNN